MPLSSQQISQFRQQGYVIAPEFFTPREVEAMQAEVARFQREGLLRNVATDGDGKTPSTRQRNLQLCPTVKHSTFFRALPFEEKVIDAVSDLLGDPFILHLDQIFLKPGGDGMGTNWHQDNAYFKIADPLKGTAMWIAVHDATVENGTIRVIPSVFHEGLPHVRDPMSDHHIRCYPDETRAIPCEIKAGGVVFFCYGTPHATGANHTQKDRAGFAYHFLRADQAQQELLAADRDYRPYLTGPQASGGMREYGVRVAGTWQNEVERLLSHATAAAKSS